MKNIIRAAFISAIAAFSFTINGAYAADQVINNNLRISGTVSAGGGFLPNNGSALASSATGVTKTLNTCNSVATASTFGTDTTPVATTFYYSQIDIPYNSIVSSISVFNGTVASGNIKVGIADNAGNILATSASTAMSGTDDYQNISLTAPISLRGPATYFVLEFVDNTTARFNTHTMAGVCVTGTVTGQVYATGFTNFTPITTFTTGVGPIASFR